MPTTVPPSKVHSREGAAELPFGTVRRELVLAAPPGTTDGEHGEVRVTVVVRKRNAA